ncbi:MAG: tetratricopeptide repeat protein [Planctomycetota bacterium]
MNLHKPCNFRHLLTLLAAAVLLQGCPLDAVPAVRGRGLYERQLLGEKLGTKEKNITTMAKMHNDVGLVEFQKGRYLNAADRFTKAITAVPDYVDAVNNLGRTYYMMGKFGQAMATLKKAQAIAESQRLNNKTILAGIHANIGDIHRQREEYSDAILEYQEVLRLAPLMPRAHYEIGNLYLKQGKYKQAIYRFDKTLELDIKYNKALLNRAICYYCIDEPEKSWKDILKLEERGFDINPKFREKVVKSLKLLKRKEGFQPGM